MSLQKRFLLFLVLLPACGLLVFLIFSGQIFRTEKLLSVQDFQTSQAGSMAILIETQIQNQPSLSPETLARNLRNDDFYRQFIIDENGHIIAQSESVASLDSISLVFGSQMLEKLNLTKTNSGTIRILDEKRNENLVSFSRISGKPWVVLVASSLKIVEQAVYSLLTKALGLFLILMAISILLSRWLAQKMSGRILDLTLSAQKFGAGDFKHRAFEQGRDELSTLGRQFNEMAHKIEASLKSEEEKVRLKLEMETAQKVQETLFLPSSFKSGNIEISGLYQPASECGGDWWYYFKKGDSIWVAIGDVTGHGVGAAMLTSSIRSAFSLIEKMDQIHPSQVLTLLNQVVWETVGGKLNMTFCVLELKPNESKLRYANASHEFPILMKKGLVLKKDDFIFLQDGSGARLGESPKSVYTELEIPFESDFRLICFSDGLSDVQNPEGKAYGERSFLKSLGSLNGSSQKPSELVNGLLENIERHRKNTVLPDDLSLLCVDFSA